MAKTTTGRKPLGTYGFKPAGLAAANLEPGPQDLAWDSIRPRPDLDTRALDPRHIFSLARSIAAVGLIQPIAIDTKGRLIAGCHRLAAWSLLSISDPTQRRDAFLKGLSDYTAPDKPSAPDKLSEPEQMAADLGELDLSGWQAAHPSGRVPVLVFDEDGARTKNKALLREIAENEKRRSYTAAEVKGLAERLKKAGFDDIKGRPEADQKSVRVELSRILGRSSRQIRRLLNDPETAKPKGGHGVRLLGRLRRQEAVLAHIKKGLAKEEGGKAILAAADMLSEAIKAYLASKQAAE